MIFNRELHQFFKLRKLIISKISIIRGISGSGSFWFWLVQVGQVVS